MPHLIGNTLHVRSIAKDAVPAIKSKQALVLILLVLVCTPQMNIKKTHARIHSIHSTLKVIRACMFICSYYDRYWRLHNEYTTNMYTITTGFTYQNDFCGMECNRWWIKRLRLDLDPNSYSGEQLFNLCLKNV